MRNITNFLDWWCYDQQVRSTFYDLVLPTFVTHDETEYLSITGPDAENLPPFAFCEAYIEQYTTWALNKYAGINFVAAETKLDGIEANATANSPDGDLLDRDNHTGTQTASTINDFNTAVDSRISNIIGTAPANLDTLQELAAALGNNANFASSITTSLAGKFNNPTGNASQVVLGDGTLGTLPVISAPTVNNNVARSLNSNYTISATKHARVSYSVNVSWNLAALLSGNATAFLEYSTNAGSTWTTVNQVSKSIGLLTFAGADDLNLVGEIPANGLVRIRTTASNMTVAYTRGQEVLQ